MYVTIRVLPQYVHTFSLGTPFSSHTKQEYSAGEMHEQADISMSVVNLYYDSGPKTCIDIKTLAMSMPCHINTGS